MLHILLLILKIIGIILLSIIGLILFLIAIILFVPIRYGIDVGVNDKDSVEELLLKNKSQDKDSKTDIRVFAKITWLLKIFRVNISFVENKLDYNVYALFFKVYSKDGKDKETVADSTTQEDTLILDESVAETLEAEELEVENSITEDLTVENSVTEDVNQLTQMEQALNASDKRDSDNKNPDNSNSDNSNPDNSNSDNNDSNNSDIYLEDIKTEEKKKPKISLKQRLMKLKNTVTEKVNGIITKVCELHKKGEDMIDYINDPQNKEMIALIWNSVKKIIKDILPKKFFGRVDLGLSDPSLTGQIYGGFCVLNTFKQYNIIFEPYFEDEIIRVNLGAKGKIYIISLVVIGVKLYMNKSFRKLIRR